MSDSKPGSAPHSRPIFSDEAIDLKQLVRAVWRYRLHAVLIGAIGAASGLVVGHLSGRYVAEGLLLTPDLNISNYKKYEIALSNAERLRAFVGANDLDGSQTAELFEGLAVSPDAVGRAVRPVFSITGREAKAYDVRTEGPGELIGIQLSVARGERTAESPIQNLADFVRHTMIDVDLRDTFLTQCLAFEAMQLRLRTDQLESDFVVSQAREHAEQLREIMRRVPMSSGIEARQVISLEAGKERFLSPTVQLVAVEVEIAESELNAEKRKRELTEAQLRKAYYCGAKELQEAHPTGQQLLKQLEHLQTSVFASEDMENDTVEKVFNEITLQRRAWIDRYTVLTRFVASPDGGERLVRKPGRLLGAMLGGVLGGGMGIMLAFLFAWWHDNREQVISADEE